MIILYIQAEVLATMAARAIISQGGKSKLCTDLIREITRKWYGGYAHSKAIFGCQGT